MACLKKSWIGSRNTHLCPVYTFKYPWFTHIRCKWFLHFSQSIVLTKTTSLSCSPIYFEFSVLSQKLLTQNLFSVNHIKWQQSQVSNDSFFSESVESEIAHNPIVNNATLNKYLNKRLFFQPLQRLKNKIAQDWFCTAEILFRVKTRPVWICIIRTRPVLDYLKTDFDGFFKITQDWVWPVFLNQYRFWTSKKIKK